MVCRAFSTLCHGGRKMRGWVPQPLRVWATNLQRSVIGSQKQDKEEERAQYSSAEVLREVGGAMATGSNKEKHRLENKKNLVRMQEEQPVAPYWTTHGGLLSVPTPKAARPTYKESMRPAGLATLHPVADALLDYAMKGCPARTRRPWTLEKRWQQSPRGPTG